MGLRLSVLLILCFSLPAWALVPLESILLGDFSQIYKEEKDDPLLYVFQYQVDAENASISEYQDQLTQYRGMLQEGENLQRYCKETKSEKFLYGNPEEQKEALRSIVATMQYIGLDLSSRAIGSYAKELNFSEDEYNNLVEKIVGNYCSSNISVISKKELKKYLLQKFVSNNYQTPTVEGNPYFSQKLTELQPRDQQMVQELNVGIRFFRSVCSWNGDTEDLRLMAAYTRYAPLMAFIIRQMLGERLTLDPITGEIIKINDTNTIKVKCSNFVCRKLGDLEKEQQMFRQLKNKTDEFNLKRLYCDDLRDREFYKKGHSETINLWIKNTTQEEQNLLTGYFYSLITGIPDFLVDAKKYSDAKDFLRFNMDRAWDMWAVSQSTKLNRDLFYEEPLTVEKVQNSLYFNPWKPEFKVVFDINVGEFDRVNQMIGKVKTSFEIKLYKGFIRWIRWQWLTVDPTVYDRKDRIVQIFKEHIKKDVENFKKKFLVSLWKGDIETIIAKELLTQFATYKGDYFDDLKNDQVIIPVELHFAPFALRQIHYKYQVKKNEEMILKRKETDFD